MLVIFTLVALVTLFDNGERRKLTWPMMPWHVRKLTRLPWQVRMNRHVQKLPRPAPVPAVMCHFLCLIRLSMMA